jgi:ferrous iron transport protein A
MNTLDLTAMKAGTTGTVVKILGGHGVVRRLDALGIRPGVHLTKRSSQLMRGPVTVAIGNTQIAIGFGMAKKIILEPNKQE